LKSLIYDVFGRQVLISRTDCGWASYYMGAEGKRRPALGIIVPKHIEEPELEQYLGDLCHEWATELPPNVKRLD